MTWDTRAEMLIGGVWEDVTDYIRHAHGVSIVDGLRDEGGRSDVATCTFKLDNSDGRFSPRNPSGAWSGDLQRNVRFRYSLPATEKYLTDYGVDGPACTTPDSVALSPGSDVEIIIDVDLDDWRSETALVHKWTTSGNQRTCSLMLLDGGRIKFQWSSDGTTGGIGSYTTTQVLPYTTGRASLRIAFDGNNGSGGHDYDFYYSFTPGFSGPWTALDSYTDTSGTATMYDSTSQWGIGDVIGGARFSGQVFGVSIRTTIGGTPVAEAVLDDETAGATTFTDGYSNTWTVSTGAEIEDRGYRFWGEIPELPSTWDKTARDVTVAAVAADPTRRLGRKKAPAVSLYRKSVTAPDSAMSSVIAYWPMEDADGSTKFASAIAGGRSMGIYGSPTLASDSSSFVASDPLPVADDAFAAAGSIRWYTSTGVILARMFLAVPDGGTSTDARIFQIVNSGSAARWNLHLGTTGTMWISVDDGAGTSLLTTSGSAFGMNGTTRRVGLLLQQSGSDVYYQYGEITAGTSSGSYVDGTLSSQTIGTATWIAVSPDRGNLSGCTVGHMTVQSASDGMFTFWEELGGYTGETAVERFARLCSEAGIESRYRGAPESSVVMGPQRTAQTMTLLRTVPEADGGIMSSLTTGYGLMYRTLPSLWSQPARVTLDYDDKTIFGLTPVDDDRYIVNDYTLTRVGGSSVRVVQETGSLSVEDPPDGVGAYDSSGEAVLYSDTQLPGRCSWIVHEGTVDEARYPTITVHMDAPAIAGDSDLSAQIQSVRIGDLIVVENLPSHMPPDDVRQIVVGRSELSTPEEWQITFVCQPASPFDVGRYEDPDYQPKYASDGSELGSSATSTATSLSVATASGPLWNYVDDFNMKLGGEEVTVTGISGSSSPQTFTVTRSTNGVVSSHDSGTPIVLAQHAYYGVDP